MDTKPGALIAVEVLQWTSAGLCALGAVGAAASAQLGVAAWNAFVAGMYCLVALKLRRGSEGARSLLIFASYTSLVFAAFLLVFAIVLFTSFGTPQLAGGLIVSVVVAFMAAQGGYTLHTLRRRDVQEWMFERSVGQI